MEKAIKILLVDDQLDFIDPMAFWLKSEGFATIVEDDCENALKIIREGAPDAVFLDIVMSGMDGLAMLRKIREFNKTIPIVLMSSFVKNNAAENVSNPYNISGIFYKGDDFSKALAFITSALKIKN